MSMNKVLLNGRLPKFDARYFKGENKTSLLNWCLNVTRNYKKADEKYYPSDLIKFKAFGKVADMIINNFNQGDGLIIEGSLQIEDDYQDKNGNTVKGQMVVIVEKVLFADGKAANVNSKAANIGNKDIKINPVNKVAPPLNRMPFNINRPTFGK